jgi:3,4-dihydroxy 2-butanone 4-phosphate synthase/GTP cyclohydrolase II
MLNSIEDALLDIKNGKMIIVVDDENRENEGDFIMAAEHATPEAINFMITQGKGLVCAPISNELAIKFGLNPMVERNEDSMQTAFTVSIDAKENITTGISSFDRAHTLKLLTKKDTTAADFSRPGHVFPLIAKDGGVLTREGHTEAAIDLALLNGLAPAGIICEILDEDGLAMRLPELLRMSKRFDLKLISIEALIDYKKKVLNINESEITETRIDL